MLSTGSRQHHALAMPFQVLHTTIPAMVTRARPWLSTHYQFYPAEPFLLRAGCSSPAWKRKDQHRTDGKPPVCKSEESEHRDRERNLRDPAEDMSRAQQSIYINRSQGQKRRDMLPSKDKYSEAQKSTAEHVKM